MNRMTGSAIARYYFAQLTLFGRADSWYMAANVPGKAQQMIKYPCGIHDYLAQWREAKQPG
jgi:hypothetical protein